MKLIIPKKDNFVFNQQPRSLTPLFLKDNINGSDEKDDSNSIIVLGMITITVIWVLIVWSGILCKF